MQKRHTESKWFLQTKKERQTEAKERKSEKQSSAEQIVTKKNPFACNWLNIIEKSSLIWDGRSKDIKNYTLVSLNWLTGPFFLWLCLRCWALTGRIFAFAKEGPDLTQKGNLDCWEHFFYLNLGMWLTFILSLVKRYYSSLMRWFKTWQWPRRGLFTGCT